MHAVLLLLGGALIAYAGTLGKSLLAGILMVTGAGLTAISKRDRVPLLKQLPSFAPAGTTLAMGLSVICLFAGVIALGLPSMFNEPAAAIRIFSPVLGWSLLMLFHTEDLIGIAPVPPTAMVLLAGSFLLSVGGCAHVKPVGSCLEEKLGPRAPGVLAEVIRDLAAQNWNDLLLSLGPDVGWDALSCALDEVMKSSTDPVKADRARMFKAKNAAKLAGK